MTEIHPVIIKFTKHLCTVLCVLLVGSVNLRLNSKSGKDTLDLISRPAVSLRLHMPLLPSVDSVYTLGWTGVANCRIQVNRTSESVEGVQVLALNLESEDGKPKASSEDGRRRPFLRYPPEHIAFEKAPEGYKSEVNKIENWLERYFKSVRVESLRETDLPEESWVKVDVSLPPLEIVWSL